MEAVVSFIAVVAVAAVTSAKINHFAGAAVGSALAVCWAFYFFG